MKRSNKLILLSYVCIASLSAAVITPALPIIQQQFGLSLAGVQWCVTLYLLGYVVGQLVYGPIANRFNALRALRAGLCLNLVGVGLCIAASHWHSYEGLLLGRVITALGASSGLACTFMLIHAYCDEEEAKETLAYTIVSFTLGIGLAVSVGGALTQYFSWQSCFYVLFGHGVLMLLSTYLFHYPEHEPIPINLSTIVRGYSKALVDKQLVFYSIVVGFAAVLGYCFSTAAPIIADTQLGLTPSHYGLWNFINMAGMLASGLLAKKFMKRFEPKSVLLFALLASFLGVISLGLFYVSASQSVWWFFLSTMWLYLTTGVAYPCASFFATKTLDDKASASSMMSFINMGAAMLMVVIMGHLSGSSLAAFSLVIGGYALLATLSFTLASSRES